MIFRSAEDRFDLQRSWARPDRPFFAAGACHILAGVFLETFPRSGFHALMIQPKPGFRGSHVLVSNGRQVFDYHGYGDARPYFLHYFSKAARLLPG
jgi:hypothetical protein